MMRQWHRPVWILPILMCLSLSCSSPNTGNEALVIIPGSGAPTATGLFITTPFGPEIIAIWRSPSGIFRPSPNLSAARARSQNAVEDIPQGYRFEVPYPNPFSDSLTVTYSLPATSHVRVWIVRARWVEDVSSGLSSVGGGVIAASGAYPVRSLVPISEQDAGYQSVVWDGTDDDGERVQKGFYRVYASINDNVFWHDVLLYGSLDDLPSDLRSEVERTLQVSTH